MGRKSTKHIKVFYCYAHEDKALREELEKHLTPLKRIGKIVTWCDRAISPGTEWERKISEEIDAADIVILLISPDFMASDYCYGKEMKRAYERHLAGEAHVISIILRPVLWKGTTVGKFQLLPSEGKPVTKWANRDEAFENIAQGIDLVVEALLLENIGGQPYINNHQGRTRQSARDLPLSGLSRHISQSAKGVKGPSRLSVPKEADVSEQYKGVYNNRNEVLHLGRHTMLQDRYMILRTVGIGGMAVVYQARDTKLHTLCAIKEMNLAWISAVERPQAIQNFKIEAKIQWALSHPNLPAFNGFFFNDQRYFIVMEYIDGTTLEALLERQGAPFPERRVLGWVHHLCDVLEYLHLQNPPIIFRDMKPGNIMLTRNGDIKLIDLGISRFFHSGHSHDTEPLGTPGFAPPEQYGKAQTDERSDIYSLAITLFMLLTNTLSETGFGLKNVRSYNPDISPIVARVLEKAASLSPDDRFDDVAAFRRALFRQY